MTMGRACLLALAGLVLCAAGCSRKPAEEPAPKNVRPLTGKWREIGSEAGRAIEFDSYGSYREMVEDVIIQSAPYRLLGGGQVRVDMPSDELSKEELKHIPKSALTKTWRYSFEGETLVLTSREGRARYERVQ